MLARLLLCWVLMAGGAAGAEAPRPVADFARLPFMENPQLSPDGKRIAAQVASNGKQFLAMISLDGAPVRLAGAGKLDLNWFRWVNGDWLVASVADVVPVAGTEIYATRLLRVGADFTGMKILGGSELGQYADRLVWVAHDGSARILLGRQTSIYASNEGFYPDVVEIDLASGKMSRAQKSTGGVMHWYADGQGVVRMGVGHSMDGRSQRLLYRSARGGEMKTVDRADRRKDEALTRPIAFLPDGKTALAISDDAEGYSVLHELDLESLKPGKKLFGRKGYDIEYPLLDGTRSTLLGVPVVEDRMRVHWTDPELVEVQAAIDAAVGPTRHARIVSWSNDRVRLLVHVGTASDPGRFYIFDRTSGRMQHLSYVNEAIKAPLHPVSTIRYKARDGLEIPAILTLPKGREAKGLPLIVMPHGGPQVRDSEEWDWWAQFMADRGYAVVKPNYRGSAGFGSRFLERGEGQWGLSMQDDLNDAVTHLAGLGLADPKRVCMVGASYGGYAAMRAAQRDGALYRCAVSFAGVSDLVRLKGYNARFLYGGVRGDFLKRQAPDLALVSPANFATEFSTPILLVHGREDKRVPVSQSRIMAERLKAAGKPVLWVEQKEGDHHLSREADRLQFLELLEGFLKEHNPA